MFVIPPTFVHNTAQCAAIASNKDKEVPSEPVVGMTAISNCEWNDILSSDL